MKSKLRRILSLSITLVVVIVGIFKNNLSYKENVIIENDKQVIALNLNVEYDIKTDLDNFILENEEKFNFYSDLFQISLDDIKDQILIANKDNRLNHKDLFNNQKIYQSLDLDLINNLLRLEKENNKLFNKKINKEKNINKEYIYGLINYFSTIYNNVDYTTLASITYIETGNLNAKTMLNYNNIYGGMVNNTLLRYKNIEYGVLQYVRLMSEKYYGKGLTTINQIASIYNQENPNWSSNVKSVTKYFSDYEEISQLSKLLELR